MKFVFFVNTNESPLWSLASKLPDFFQEPDINLEVIKTWIKTKHRGADLVILLFQSDGPIGYIALDGHGTVLNLEKQ